jgi:hypothetical protein
VESAATAVDGTAVMAMAAKVMVTTSRRIKMFDFIFPPSVLCYWECWDSMGFDRQNLAVLIDEIVGLPSHVGCGLFVVALVANLVDSSA